MNVLVNENAHVNVHKTVPFIKPYRSPERSPERSRERLTRTFKANVHVTGSAKNDLIVPATEIEIAH